MLLKVWHPVERRKERLCHSVGNIGSTPRAQRDSARPGHSPLTFWLSVSLSFTRVSSLSCSFSADKFIANTNTSADPILNNNHHIHLDCDDDHHHDDVDLVTSSSLTLSRK